MNLFRIPRWLSFVLMFLTAACAAVGPDHMPPVANIPVAWNQLDTSSQPMFQPASCADLSSWWQNLHDPLLSELIEEALRANPNLRLAQARLREARARRAVSMAGFFPNVSASGKAMRSQSSSEAGSGQTRELYSTGLDASWEIDIFGGKRRAVEAAQAELEAVQADLHATQVSLTAEVALNYIETRALQMRLRIASDNLASQSETYQLTEWRVQAGLANSLAVEQARSNQEQTRAQIPNLKTNLAEAQHRLDVLLGIPPGTLQKRIDSVGNLPVIPERIAVGIPADALRQRPDILAAERRLAAENARVGVAVAAQYPSLTLSGSLGLEALTAGALGNSGAETWSLLGGLTAPIFNAGRLRNQVEIQDAVHEQALINYEQTVLTALQNVENALVSIARNRERTEALSVAADAARKAAELAGQRYSTGLVDFQTVLDTQRSVLILEDNLASARADDVLALIQLYKAMGGGWSPRTDSAQTLKETP